MKDLQLAAELLDNNTLRNHYRLLKTLIVVLSLILVVTAYLKYVQLASASITYCSIIRVGAISYLILGILFLVIKFFGRSSWTKWAAVVSIVLILVVLRTAAHDAPETHALFFLAIILSLFYFDPWLTLFCTVLCMGADILLIQLYPQLYPGGKFGVAIIIRYLNYLWVGLAGAAGTRATKELIEVAADLRETNNRLMEVINRERELERMRKEFISQVSHELKSPLGLVEGYAEALRDDIKQEKRNHYLTIIIDEVKKMGMLINNMLWLAQHEGGYIRLKTRWFDICSLTRKVTDQYNNLVEERNLLLRFVIPHEVMVEGDPLQIEHVLENFLTNAIRHTPDHGTIVIFIFPEGDRVRISIFNEGESIAPEDMAHIWEPFYRADKSGNRKFGGTGLGLSVAGTVLKLHKSEYGANNINNGVQFYFYLTRINENRIPIDNSKEPD